MADGQPTCQNPLLLLSLVLQKIHFSGYGSFLTCSLTHVAVVPVCSKVSTSQHLLQPSKYCKPSTDAFSTVSYKWDGIGWFGSPGGVRYRARYSAKNHIALTVSPHPGLD